MRVLTLLFSAVVLSAICGWAVTFDRDLDAYTVLAPNEATAKRTLVFVGDGFSFSEQRTFQKKVDDVITHLRKFPPFATNLDLFRIVRMNVLSPESGIDHPNEGIRRHSAFNSKFGTTTERYIKTDDAGELLALVDFYLPDSFVNRSLVIVLVNDTAHGGSAEDRVLYASIRKDFVRVVSHELGHAVGLLADEYGCRICDGSDDNNSNCHFSGQTEICDNSPPECNVTELRKGDPAKWSPDAAQQIGLIEGARYFRYGMFRSQDTCHMRALDSPFCKICLRAFALRFQEMRDGVVVTKPLCQPKAPDK